MSASAVQTYRPPSSPLPARSPKDTVDILARLIDRTVEIGVTPDAGLSVVGRLVRLDRQAGQIDVLLDSGVTSHMSTDKVFGARVRNDLPVIEVPAFIRDGSLFSLSEVEGPTIDREDPRRPASEYTGTLSTQFPRKS